MSCPTNKHKRVECTPQAEDYYYLLKKKKKEPNNNQPASSYSYVVYFTAVIFVYFFYILYFVTCHAHTRTYTHIQHTTHSRGHGQLGGGKRKKKERQTDRQQEGTPTKKSRGLLVVVSPYLQPTREIKRCCSFGCYCTATAVCCVRYACMLL